MSQVIISEKCIKDLVHNLLIQEGFFDGFRKKKTNDDVEEENYDEDKYNPKTYRTSGGHDIPGNELNLHNINSTDWYNTNADANGNPVTYNGENITHSSVVYYDGLPVKVFDLPRKKGENGAYDYCRHYQVGDKIFKNEEELEKYVGNLPRLDVNKLPASARDYIYNKGHEAGYQQPLTLDKELDDALFTNGEIDKEKVDLWVNKGQNASSLKKPKLDPNSDGKRAKVYNAMQGLNKSYKQLGVNRTNPSNYENWDENEQSEETHNSTPYQEDGNDNDESWQDERAQDREQAEEGNEGLGQERYDGDAEPELNNSNHNQEDEKFKPVVGNEILDNYLYPTSTHLQNSWDYLVNLKRVQETPQILQALNFGEGVNNETYKREMRNLVNATYAISQLQTTLQGLISGNNLSEATRLELRNQYSGQNFTQENEQYIEFYLISAYQCISNSILALQSVHRLQDKQIRDLAPNINLSDFQSFRAQCKNKIPFLKQALQSISQLLRINGVDIRDERFQTLYGINTQLRESLSMSLHMLFEEYNQKI